METPDNIIEVQFLYLKDKLKSNKTEINLLLENIKKNIDDNKQILDKSKLTIYTSTITLIENNLKIINMRELKIEKQLSKILGKPI
jgi:hypothetical protein